MRIGLWSYNYDPEPSGIAPLSTAWARAMVDRGHDVHVVAAHPHYPAPMWGRRVRPYREERDGISVYRLPIWPGRDTPMRRIRQELSYAGALTAVAALLPRADVIVAVTPSFPALAPAMAIARARALPWVMWLQDVLPDGAAATGQLAPGAPLRAARRFEREAYRSAAAIVVVSDAFRRNLLDKGVPAERVVRIYNPSLGPVPARREQPPPTRPRRALVMGNIGHTQGLAAIVEELERSDVLRIVDAELRIAGDGVARDAVAGTIRSERVRMLGVLLATAMEDELANAQLGLVTQRAGIPEFNLPSKLMNYMAHGVPVLAIVEPGSETARIVRDSGGGWVVDAAQPRAVAAGLAAAITDTGQLALRGQAALQFAARHFDPRTIAAAHERVLTAALRGQSAGDPASASA